MDTQTGLPRLSQVFPTDGYKGQTTIDIIAVHGIETHSPKTWIAYEQDEEPKGRARNWLRDEDMLPKVIPQARIWTYDYNSNCYSDNAQEVDILGLGDTFLEVLWGAKDKDLGSRPLLFIGSCFGGIVVAQALERASRDLEKYVNVLKSTIGVVFLGTPLRGTATASIAEWLALIRSLMGKETSRTLLKSLRDKAGSLDVLIHDFAMMAIKHELQIRCFYETRTTQIVNALSRRVASIFPSWEVRLVPKSSASLDGHQRFPLDIRHAMMNKYRGPNDTNFKLVSGSLKELAENARIRRDRTKEELECLQCFTSNYREHKDRNERRVPRTCEWVLGNQKFIDWRQKNTASLLWISADPGCGKSVLSRALVDEGLLSLDYRNSSACYFFFKDDDDSRKSGANALCAILHQLFVQKPALLKHAIRPYEQNGQHLRTMFGELWDILILCARDLEAGEIICVLDALDECREAARNALIKALCEFYMSHRSIDTKLKFLVTSRPYDKIEKSFYNSIEDMSTIRLKGEFESQKISEEIDLVINHRVPLISKARNSPLKPDVQKALMEYLTKVPHRTYLWLHLILDVIRTTLDSTTRRLERLISKLPRTVEDAYEKILTRIDGSDSVEQARRLLHIIVAAVRPLTLQEMNIALAIDGTLERQEPCQSYNDLDLESEGSFRDRVRNLCGLFVSIIDSKIYLIHQTARDFLISQDLDRNTTSSSGPSCEVWRHSLNLAESNLICLKVCLSFLQLQELNDEVNVVDEISTDEGDEEDDVGEKDEADGKAGFDEGVMGGDLVDDSSLNPGSFLDYAANYWATHFRKGRIGDNESVLQSTLNVCDVHSNRFHRWFRVYCYSTQTKYSQRTSYLTIASLLGLEAVVKLLLKMDSVDVNQKDNYLQTPVSCAISKGHVEIVKLLLEHDIDLNLRDAFGNVPLMSAAQNGYVEIVKLLLEHDVDTNFNVRGQTPLTYAVENGLVEIVKLLLEHDVDPNLKGEWGQTPLKCAVRYGHIEIVKLLLNTGGVDVNIGQETPLMWAAQEGHVEIVKLLLERGAKLNLKATSGRTPLSWAAEGGSAELVKLLLKRDARLDIKDNSGRTPLSWAAEGGFAEVAKLLLELGARLDIKDNSGRTPLSFAVRGGFADVVKLLLEFGAEFDLKNNSKETPLLLAARRGSTEVVKLLLEFGTEPDSKDDFGGTPLLLAARKGFTKLVKLLLERGAQFDLKDNSGRTSLSWAAQKGFADVVSLLFERSAEFNLQDNHGKTPLLWAARGGSAEVVKLLLNRGAELYAMDTKGNPRLLLALNNEHDEVVKLLQGK